MNFNFNQALADKGRRADEGMRQEWQKINDNYEIGKLNALNGGGGGSAVKPALGLAAAKTPTFSNMISPSIGYTGSTVSASNYGKLPTNSSVFDDPLVRQGMRRGNTYVKDKTGRGDPKKDTVPAELAEGEAVINAYAMAVPGRRELVAEWNAEGAAAMGLRGGAKMKDGVMHAVTGVERIKAKDLRDALKQRPSVESLLNETPEQAYANNANSAARAEAEAAAARVKPVTTAAPAKVPTSTPPKVTLRGVGAAAGSAATLGGYMSSPEEDKVSALQGFGPMGAMVGLAGRAMQPLRDKLYAPAYEVGDKMMNNVKDNLGMSDQAAAPAAAPKPAETPVMELAGAPSAYEQGVRAQVGVRKADNAEFSKFFNQNGITDDMRANPAQAGLRRVNVPGSTDRIYQRGKNEFVGMGAPSRIAAEKARAEDPAVQKAAQMKELYTLATQGNEQAGETLRQIIKADSDLAVEGLRGKATIEAAGAKGSGKKGDGTTLTDQLKMGATLLGEGREAELLQAVSQRKQTSIAERIAAGDKDGAKAIQDADLDQDFIMETANLLKQRELAAGNGKGKRAAYGGAAGAIGGGLLGLGAGIGLKQPKMISAGIGSLAGALGGGLYGYETGSSGVDEFSDLNRVAGLKNNQGALTEEGGGMVIPGDLLTPDQQVLRGLRR